MQANIGDATAAAAEPLEREYAALLDDYANRLSQQGKIDSAYAEQDFAERFAAVNKAEITAARQSGIL